MSNDPYDRLGRRAEHEVGAFADHPWLRLLFWSVAIVLIVLVCTAVVGLATTGSAFFQGEAAKRTVNERTNVKVFSPENKIAQIAFFHDTCQRAVSQLRIVENNRQRLAGDEHAARFASDPVRQQQAQDQLAADQQDVTGAENVLQATAADYNSRSAQSTANVFKDSGLPPRINLPDPMSKAFVVFAVAALTVVAVACGGNGSAAKRAANAVRTQDVLGINQQVLELRRNEPLPRFHDSAALHVQDAYYTADADPNKVWYVTLVALDGTPYAHFTTRGAPQPAGDQVTNPVQQVCAGGSNGDKNCDTVGLPEPNGVHQGANNDGYVAILTTGAMIRFGSNAVISDQPFTTKTPVRLSIDETQAISHTDTSKTTGAIVPKGTGHRR
jgi:hypothetical protein